MKSILLVLIFVSTNIHAGSQSGVVDSIIVRASDGLVYFTLKGDGSSNKDSCATYTYWVIKDENSNTEKQQYSMILTAQATQRTIKAVGINSCTRWCDGEDVDYIQTFNLY